ncbi:MAG: hypothetical protein MJZ05_01060 [Fibrobacter sp.]|nr:hypothetical protein [Fibrobacter sp.]
MNRKILSLLTVASFALFMSACGGDDKKNGVGPEVTCEDTENCLDEDDDAASSSSVKSSSSSKKDNKSSSSVKEDKDKSSSSAKEDKDEDKSSSSEAKDDDKSSDSKDESSSSAEETADSSSSSEEAVDSSSSSEEPAESSSSEEVKPVEYANTTPNLADLEVSGDTLFAVFQRQNSDYSITHNGLLAMYKLSDGTLLDTIQLATQNPSAVKVAGGNVYVATAGAYDAFYNLPADNKRGIEKVDLKKKTSSLFISATRLGGGVQDFVVDKKNNKGYATVYYGYGSVAVAEIDLATGTIMTLPDFADASGSLEFDESTSTLYVGDRFMDWETGDMHIGVFAYKNGTLTAVSDAEPDEEIRMPYSIKAINGVPYVFVSDYYTGALYVDYADSESDGTDFNQDSKLAAVNGELFLMERGDAATIAKINTADGSATWQSIASGKNPYDMVAASATTAWVAYYGTPTLELISTSNGSSVKLIDTKEFCAVKVDATDED